MRTKNVGFRQPGTISLTGRVDNPRQNELSSSRGLHIPLLLGKKKPTETEADQNAESDDTVINTVSSNVKLGCLPDEVLAFFDKSVVNEIKNIESSISNKAVRHNKDCVNVGGLAELFNAAEINEAKRDETPSTSVQEERGNSIENDNCID